MLLHCFQLLFNLPAGIFQKMLSVYFMRRFEVVSKLDQFEGTEILRIWRTPHTLSRSFLQGKIGRRRRRGERGEGRRIMTMTSGSDRKITSPHTCALQDIYKYKYEYKCRIIKIQRPVPCKTQKHLGLNKKYESTTHGYQALVFQ